VPAGKEARASSAPSAAAPDLVAYNTGRGLTVTPSRGTMIAMTTREWAPLVDVRDAPLSHLGISDDAPAALRASVACLVKRMATDEGVISAFTSAVAAP
jgi:hypothetical protein